MNYQGGCPVDGSQPVEPEGMDRRTAFIVGLILGAFGGIYLTLFLVRLA